MQLCTNSCINQNTYQLIAFEPAYRFIFMNTDMSQYVIFRKSMGMLINYCKRNDSLSAESLVLGKLAHQLCLQSTFLVNIFITYIVGA